MLLVTRDEAKAEAARRQGAHPEAKWIATKHDGEWVIACVGLAPAPIEVTGVAIKPPPMAPSDVSQSELQRITTQFGSFS